MTDVYLCLFNEVALSHQIPEQTTRGSCVAAFLNSAALMRVSGTKTRLIKSNDSELAFQRSAADLMPPTAGDVDEDDITTRRLLCWKQLSELTVNIKKLYYCTRLVTEEDIKTDRTPLGVKCFDVFLFEVLIRHFHGCPDRPTQINITLEIHRQGL